MLASRSRELPADGAVGEAWHEPNGYFWEGVAIFLDPDLVQKLDLDSEGSMFSAGGSREDLEQLQMLMEPLLSDPDTVRRLIERAESKGFEFDD